MKLTLNEPVRNFVVGENADIEISDVGSVMLVANELLCITNEMNETHEIVCKEWGFYATASIDKRLFKNGFLTALVTNKHSDEFIMLVSKSKLSFFQKYCRDEQMLVKGWLNCQGTEHANHSQEQRSSLDCECSEQNTSIAYVFDEPPKGETDFGYESNLYKRWYEKCSDCAHFFGRTSLDLTKIYSGKYVEDTYGKSLGKTFTRIISLPKNKSDNYFRVEYISDFFWLRGTNITELQVLDVGSGLGVFPYLMKQKGFNCEALDPDPAACAHIKERVGVEVFQSDFFELEAQKQYDLITFNKVLEHVWRPGNMLNHAKNFLKPMGFVYLEVPDAEIASEHSFCREEFYIEHLHGFSLNSLIRLIDRLGLRPLSVTRIVEPSGKFTLRAIAQNVEK